jgi:biotin carboxyl carrier protein
MIFQAETGDGKWEITVNESKEGWQVTLKPEHGSVTRYEFSRSEYQYMDETISFLFKNSSYLLDVTNDGLNYTVYTRGAFRTIKLYNEEKILHESLKTGGALGRSSGLTSQMPGKIRKVFVKAGDTVKAGDPLLIMEAMKMENEIRADHEGKVATVHVTEGVNIEANAPLISFEKN